MRCEEIVQLQCPKNHVQSRRCSDTPAPGCKKCDREEALAEKKRQRDYALQKKRDDDEAEHLRQKKDIDEQIAEERARLRDIQLKLERQYEIEQKKADLDEAQSFSRRARSQSKAAPVPSQTTPERSDDLPGAFPASPSHSPQPNDVESKQTLWSNFPASRPTQTPSSPAAVNSASKPSGSSPSEAIWTRKKTVEGVTNAAIDSIMAMTGLEEVKSQVLRILDKIDVASRQGIAFDKERYNLVLLGNPGTGTGRVFLLSTMPAYWGYS